MSTRAGTVVVDVEADASRFLKDIDNASKQAGRSLMGGLGNVGKTVFSDLAANAQAAATAVGVIGGIAIKVAADFNKGMSAVGAVAGATASELDGLREAALDAGAATVFSASEAATAEAELARAGVSVADILGGGLRGSLDLAAAGQLELGNAAEISAQAMNVFKLEGKDVAHIADVLAAGANKSAADVGQLGDALRQGGLVAAQTGLDLETTVGALAAFADRALIGSDAGTSLKTMLQRLVPTGAPAREAMNEIGFSAYDAAGNFVGLADVAQQLQDGLKNLSDEQRSAALTTIFGSDAVRGASVLYELGAAGVNEYTAAVNDQGAAQEVAAKQLDNLSGDLEAFAGSTETAMIRVGDLADSSLRMVVQGASELVNQFNEFAATPAWEQIDRRFDRLLAGAGGLQSIADEVSGFLDGIDVDDVNRFFDTIERGRDQLTGVADHFGALSGVTAGLGSSFALMGLRSLPVIGAFAPAISPVTAVLGGLLLGTDRGREGLGQLAESFKSVARESGPEVVDSVGEIADVIGGALGDVLGELAPVLEDAANDLLPLFAHALEDIAPAAAEVVVEGGHLVAEVLPELVNLLETAAPILDVIAPGLRLTADALGFMADNAEILVPPLAAVVGYLKVKALLDGSKLIGGLTTGVAGLSRAAGGAGLAGVLYEGAGKVDGFGSALGKIATPLGAAVTAAGAGFIAYQGLTSAFDNAGRAGKQAAADFAAGREFDVSTATFESLNAEIDAYRAKIDALHEDRGNAINPFTDRRLGDNIRELTDLSGAYVEVAHHASELAAELGLNEDAAVRLALRQEALGAAFGSNASLADSFRDALNRLNPAGREVADATINVEEAVDALGSSLVLNGKSFDVTTDAGRSNARALSDLSDRARELAANMIEQDGNLQGAKDSLLGYTAGLRETLTQAGLTNAQIDALLKTYGLSPDQITTIVEEVGAEQTVAKIEALRVKARETVDQRYQAEIDVLLNTGDVDAAERKLNDLARQRVVDILYGTPQPRPGTRGNGLGVVVQARGGVVDYFAGGGIREDHIAQIAPAGSWRVWGEPETGGEAYIPLAPAKRERSLDLYEAVGQRLGVERATGTVVNHSTNIAAGAIVVHAAPGMDAKELSEMVYEEFAERAYSDGAFLSRIGAAN